MFKVLIAAILGGAISFAWTSASWMFLPWHQQTIKQFDNEQVIVKALKSQAEEDGIYLLPKIDQNSSKPMQTIASTETFAFISLRPNGTTLSMQDSMKFSFLNSVLISILIVILLSCTSDLGYIARVFFVMMVGLVGALSGHVPNLIWWGFDSSYTIVMIVDIVISWFLAGLVIAAFVGREPDFELND
ncbi:MAG: hypothetical protein AB8D52_13350 [Gammaproteobacteria bacterium]